MDLSLSRQRALDLLTLCLLCLGVYVAFQPDGIVGRRLQEYSARRDYQRNVAQLWDEMAASSHRLFGEASPPTVLEFSDYECPFCRATSAAVDSASAAGVRVGYLHMPLRSHPYAAAAAAAAICAENFEVFAGVHYQLMKDSAWRARGDVAGVLLANGAKDTAAVRACLVSEDTRRRIDQHSNYAEKLRIRGTPTFLSRTVQLSGVASMAQLKALGNDKLEGR